MRDLGGFDVRRALPSVMRRMVERALYVVDGKVAIEGQEGLFIKDQLVVLKPGAAVVIRAAGNARLMALGGEPLEGDRHIFWNFVSSRSERIEQAAADWRAGRFRCVPGDGEFIPASQDSLDHARMRATAT